MHQCYSACVRREMLSDGKSSGGNGGVGRGERTGWLAAALAQKCRIATHGAGPGCAKPRQRAPPPWAAARGCPAGPSPLTTRYKRHKCPWEPASASRAPPAQAGLCTGLLPAPTLLQLSQQAPGCAMARARPPQALVIQPRRTLAHADFTAHLARPPAGECLPSCMPSYALRADAGAPDTTDAFKPGGLVLK